MDDADNDLVTLLLKSKSKIWEDKKRLGLLGEKHSCEKIVTTSQHSPVHAQHGSSHESKEEHNFCDNVQERKKDLLISCISSGSPGFGEQKEHKAQPMVRFGEYSPQNPGLLSPGKTLLGLGEYEEKRRHILERKKQEYLEQMVQARQEVKDAMSGRIAELSQQQDSSEFILRPHLNKKCTAGTQTDVQISGHMQDAEPSPLAAYGSVISPVAASMKTPSWEIPVLPTLSPHAQITTATQTPGGSLRPSNYESVPAIYTSGSSAVITLPQHATYVPLSPRERKMVEFRESYSPSFLQGHPCRRGRFDMTTDQTLDICRRKEAYQEELRRQIEEKQRIEAEQQKKEKEEEEAIARRVELQHERMMHEYVQEEALRRDKHLQRLHQAEDFQHRQEAWKLKAEPGHKTEARRKLGKRLKDLESGLAQHSLYSTQSLSVSLPVPALRTKHFFSESPKETTPSSCAASPAVRDVADDVIKDSSPRISDTESNNMVNIVDKRTEQTQRDSTVEYPVHNRTVDKGSPQINNLEYPLHSSDSECLLNNHSIGKEISEPVTISYHRPPTDIIKAACYGSSVQKCHIGSGTNALDVLGPRTRHSELRTESVQRVSSLLPQDTNNCGKKLDDSLPIPILRAPSPVIPTAKIGQAASGSDAVRKLEGKWQVPAVVKNVVHGSSDSNNILTQLGAMRHQLQLEQIRMEQHLQQQQLQNKT